MRIRCFTLFDITKTNVSNRRGLLDNDINSNEIKKRNQQSNFETILQVISMRSQPENITDPIYMHSNVKWGNTFKNKKIKCWVFDFEINHSYVFFDNNNELGKLFLDCEGVPMISNLDEMPKLINTLTLNEEFKNIHFEVLNGQDDAY